MMKYVTSDASRSMNVGGCLNDMIETLRRRLGGC